MNELTTANGLVQEINGQKWTTSLLVAEKFERVHSHVVKTIQTLECPKEFTDEHFLVSSYKDSTGRTHKMYKMTRDGFSLLTMGFTGAKAMKWKVDFIKAFNLATSVRSNAEITLSLAQALVNHERAVAQLAGRVDSIDSKVESLEQRLTSERINEFPEGCDRLPLIAATYFPGMSPAKVSRWLNSNQHPTREYKCSTDDGEVRSIAVFVKAGIEEARRKLMREATLVSECPRNTKYTHPKIGNFMIKKVSHLRSFMVSDSSSNHLDS